MIVNIEDREIQELMQVCVKEEVEFLTRNLLRQPRIRQYIWPFVQDQLELAAVAAGLDKDAVDLIVVAMTKISPPTGGGGGSDAGEDGGTNTGGGVDPDDPAAKKKTAK